MRNVLADDTAGDIGVGIIWAASVGISSAQRVGDELREQALVPECLVDA